MDAREKTERSTRRLASSEPVRLGARAGLCANGMLHLLVAWLAARVASGSQARADQAGALQTVASEPFGRLLLWLVVAGFVAVVLWRIREAVWGFRYLVNRRDRLSKRLFSAAQAVVFAVLAGLSGRIAGGSSGGNGGQGITATLLRLPGGQVLVLLIGVAVLVTGAVMAYRGYQMSFTNDMELGRASPTARAAAERTGQIGAVAKALAVMIVGGLIGFAAVTFQPARAEGLDAALKTLAGQPFGPLLLAVVALGLGSYGVFCFFDARYHRV